MKEISKLARDPLERMGSKRPSQMSENLVIVQLMLPDRNDIIEEDLTRGGNRPLYYHSSEVVLTNIIFVPVTYSITGGLCPPFVHPSIPPSPLATINSFSVFTFCLVFRLEISEIIRFLSFLFLNKT